VTTLVNTKLDFGNSRRITNLAAGAATGEPVTYEQMNSAIEGLAWKDNCRVAAQVNTTVSAPGATIDGITMASGDRVLLFNQTAQTENGIYVWNGAATPATRAFDAAVFNDYESAVTTIDEGTSAGSTYRQTQVNGVVGTNNIIWVAFGTSAPAATTSVAGIAALATQAEVDAGSITNKIVAPSTAKAAAWLTRKYATTIGDASSTSIVVTHNLNTTDVLVMIEETGGSKRVVIGEIQITGVNSVTCVFDVAPASNALRVVVIG
jgi:hypothetical protein